MTSESTAMYQPRPVPDDLWPLISACERGDLEQVKALWSPSALKGMLTMGPMETAHPLLKATHHMHPEVVEFLCEQGLNPTLRGTTHPYSGDSLMVSECQRVSPLSLVDKLLFHFSRRSKRRQRLLRIREVLEHTVDRQRMGKAMAESGGDVVATPSGPAHISSPPSATSISFTSSSSSSSSSSATRHPLSTSAAPSHATLARATPGEGWEDDYDAESRAMASGSARKRRTRKVVQSIEVAEGEGEGGRGEEVADLPTTTTTSLPTATSATFSQIPSSSSTPLAQVGTKRSHPSHARGDASMGHEEGRGAKRQARLRSKRATSYIEPDDDDDEWVQLKKAGRSAAAQIAASKPLPPPPLTVPKTSSSSSTTTTTTIPSSSLTYRGRRSGGARSHRSSPTPSPSPPVRPSAPLAPVGAVVLFSSTGARQDGAWWVRRSARTRGLEDVPTAAVAVPVGPSVLAALAASVAAPLAARGASLEAIAAAVCSGGPALDTAAPIEELPESAHVEVPGLTREDGVKRKGVVRGRGVFRWHPHDWGVTTMHQPLRTLMTAADVGKSTTTITTASTASLSSSSSSSSSRGGVATPGGSGGGEGGGEGGGKSPGGDETKATLVLDGSAHSVPHVLVLAQSVELLGQLRALCPREEQDMEPWIGWERAGVRPRAPSAWHGAAAAVATRLAAETHPILTVGFPDDAQRAVNLAHPSTAPLHLPDVASIVVAAAVLAHTRRVSVLVALAPGSATAPLLRSIVAAFPASLQLRIIFFEKDGASVPLEKRTRGACIALEHALRLFHPPLPSWAALPVPKPFDARTAQASHDASPVLAVRSNRSPTDTVVATAIQVEARR